MLQSLPVSKRDIIASKLLIVYIFAFCFTCGMMLPGMVVHVLITHAYLQLAFGILSLVFVPVIPIGIAIIFGVGILYVASFAKHTTVLKVLLSVFIVYWFDGRNLSASKCRRFIYYDRITNDTDIPTILDIFKVKPIICMHINRRFCINLLYAYMEI